MRLIYKYQLRGAPGMEIKEQLPVGAQIIKAAVIDGALYVWALVDPKSPGVELRRFWLFNTGAEIAVKDLRYVDTLILHSGALVFHLFEVVPVEDL